MACIVEYFNQHPGARSLKQIQDPFIWVQGNGTVSFGTGSFGDDRLGGMGATIALTADECQKLANALARNAESLRKADKTNGQMTPVQGQLVPAFNKDKLTEGDLNITFDV